MEYELIYSEKAEEDLHHINATYPFMLDFVEQHLLELGRAPVTLSREMTSPAYPASSQVYVFKHETAVDEHVFTVMFRYGQDEARLHILTIGAMRVEKDSEDWSDDPPS